LRLWENALLLKRRRDDPADELKKNMTYVTIHFESHDYTATVREEGQLTGFLSQKNETFKIGDVVGDIFPGLLSELNRISRFGKSKNITATA
jgi:hypothetical protein